MQKFEFTFFLSFFFSFSFFLFFSLSLLSLLSLISFFSSLSLQILLKEEKEIGKSQFSIYEPEEREDEEREKGGGKVHFACRSGSLEEVKELVLSDPSSVHLEDRVCQYFFLFEIFFLQMIIILIILIIITLFKNCNISAILLKKRRLFLVGFNFVSFD